MIHKETYHSILLFAIVFFFFNSFLLPHGLLYSTLLTPFMLYYLYKEAKVKNVAYWSILLLIPIPFQLFSGVALKSFAFSTLIMFTVLVFLLTALTMVKKYQNEMEELFKRILNLNSLLVIIALVILPFGIVRGLLWYEVPISDGIPIIPRLKLFTYEASYYSLIMMPVFLYFILKVFYAKTKHGLLIFIAATFPLILSLSFGVLGALAIAFIIALPFYWRSAPLDFKRIIRFGGIGVLSITILSFVGWPDNPVLFRLQNIFQGKDTSAMGRIVYSYMFAFDLIRDGKWLFGIGPGQIKILAHDMIINHYQYQGILETTVRIPNAMAETIATYGIYGFGLKLFLQVYFFIKKRVFTNFYALSLFLFIFIYQFTGSFISNVAELGVWVFVFAIVFKEFDYKKPETTINT